MKKFAAILGVCLPMLALSAFAQTQPDFRKATWGMTQEQVLASEPGSPVQISKSNGEVVVQFAAPDGSEIRGRLYYIFLDDKLVRAKYISDAEHEDPNEIGRAHV